VETASYVGLDLGKSADYTALAVVQKVGACSELHLRHLERFPLGTQYTEIAGLLLNLLSGAPFSKAKTELVVDKTGVGVAVTDLLKERGLGHTAVTITGLGQRTNRTGSREYTVPKHHLVAALEVPFHNGTLKVASGLKDWPELRGELLGFRRKQNPRTAHVSYEHWRASDHDDLLLAAALACWKATHGGKGATTLGTIR